jgi:hypothetical protein
MFRKFFAVRNGVRLSSGLFAALAVVLVPLTAGLAADAGLLRLKCTNPTGGATWAVVVDFDHSLVDSLPASISEKWINWRIAGGGIYEFERATGKLQLRAASTTGGYFLHYTCQPE